MQAQETQRKCLSGGRPLLNEAVDELPIIGLIGSLSPVSETGWLIPAFPDTLRIRTARSHMNSGWQPIDNPRTADHVSRSACWDDYPLVDWIFCHSVIPVGGDSEVQGQALRILAEAWQQRASHVEIALFDFETSVSLPPSGSFLKLEFHGADRLAVLFSRNAPASVCASGFFRFIDLSPQEASQFYRHPSILAPLESPLETEGYAEFSGAKGERLIIAGQAATPTLWLSDNEGHSVSIDLNPALSQWLLGTLHVIGNPKNERPDNAHTSQHTC